MNYSLCIQKNLLSSPGRIIITALVTLSLLGALVLWMPFCHHGTLTFTDAFFTASSLTCVTGLLVVPLSTFTFTGHCVLLFLMQIGSLGLVTLTIFLISLFFDLRLSTRYLTGEMLEIEGWNASHHLLLFIIFMTGIVETLGTAIIFFTVKNSYPWGTALFYSCFHAVSSFTSTGLSFFDTSQQTIPHDNIPLLATSALLMLMGGIGFIVWQEVYLYFMTLNKKKHFHWTLHTKVVLYTTAIITAGTTCIFFCLEHVMQGDISSITNIKPFLTAIGISLFNAIGCRSAGLTTYDVSLIHFATLFLIMIISFIGSSPGSTGSGIKTTTFALFLSAIRATIKRRSSVELKGRTIPHEQVFKAMAILSVSLSWVAVTIFFLLITEQGWRFIDIAFEAFSAFANMGLSTGITPYLSIMGKYIIIVSMFMGRIGMLTLLLAFRRQKEKKEFHYPEERVILG